MKQLLIMIFISATIGWITNWVAIKMLFRPHKEINFGLFKIQGLIPKRKKIKELIKKNMKFTFLFKKD